MCGAAHRPATAKVSSDSTVGTRQRYAFRVLPSFVASPLWEDWWARTRLKMREMTHSAERARMRKSGGL